MLRAFAVLLLGSLSMAQLPPAAAPTVVLEGRVVDLRGEGIPMASVQVVTSDPREQVLARGMCDGDGCFRIGRVPQRPAWTVVAQRDGYCRNQAYVSGEPLPIVLGLHDAVTVRGALRDLDGRPVAGATVRATLLARILFSVRADAITDADGRFTLPGVPVGPVLFCAVVPGQGLAERRMLLQRDAEIELHPVYSEHTSIVLVVADPPPGLTASIVPSDHGRQVRLPPPWDRPQFDGQGYCRLRDVPAIDYTFQVTAPGCAIVPSQVQVKAAAGPHVVHFEVQAREQGLHPYKALVRDGAGQPVGGVRLEMSDRASLARVEATSADDGAVVFGSPWATGTEVSLESLDDGWVVDDAPRGGSRLGRTPREQAVLACVLDPERTLDVQLERACTVTGRLLLPDGRPAARVTVALEASMPMQMPQWRSFARATTDRDGNYSFPRCHPGDDLVRVAVEGAIGSGHSEPFEIGRPGGRTAVRELRLSAPATIEGTVVDAQQRPAPGIRVWLRDLDLGDRQRSSGRVVEVITDKQGRYRFVGVPLGGVWLEVVVEGESADGRAVEPFEVEAGKSYTFALQVPAK